MLFTEMHEQTLRCSHHLKLMYYSQTAFRTEHGLMRPSGEGQRALLVLEDTLAVSLLL